MSSVIEFIAKAVFPNRCEICGEVIELDDNRCDDCKILEHIASPICELCGCSKEDCNCKKHKNEYKRIIAPYYYKENVVKGVNSFKSNDMPFLAITMAKEMYDCFNEHYKNIEFDLITYVPLTKKDKRKRGYNQSELLAKELSRLTGINSAEILVKTEQTKPQKTMTAKERKVNLFGAFDLKDKASVKDKSILLIDDVKTTGSTLNECAKMLKIYDAEAVYSLVYAIVNNE